MLSVVLWFWLSSVSLIIHLNLSSFLLPSLSLLLPPLLPLSHTLPPHPPPHPSLSLYNIIRGIRVQSELNPSTIQSRCVREKYTHTHTHSVKRQPAAFLGCGAEREIRRNSMLLGYHKNKTQAKAWEWKSLFQKASETMSCKIRGNIL